MFFISEIFISKKVVHNLQLSDNAIGVYVALRKIQQSRTEDFYISVNMILYNLFGNVNDNRDDRKHICAGLLELIKEKLIVVTHEISKAEFIVDAQALVIDKTVNEDDYFVKISDKELFFIMNCTENNKKRGLSKLSLLRYFINLIGTIDFNAGIYSDYAGSQKINFVGYMTQDYLCELSGIAKGTLSSFNTILEENNIIYICHHYKNRVLEDGTRRALTNHYGRYSDKEDIDKFALQYEFEKGITEKIVDAQSNTNKSLANCYRFLVNGKGGNYSDERIKQIYNYVHKCNIDYQKEIDKKNNQETLSQSEKEYLDKLYIRLRDESVFDKYDFLFNKDEFIWGENDAMDSMPSDIFESETVDYPIEEILDMPCKNDLDKMVI